MTRGYKKKGRPWPFINFKSKSRGSGNAGRRSKPIVVIPNHYKSKKNEDKKSQTSSKDNKSTSIQSITSSLSKMSFLSVDEDNTSRITTTDAVIEASEDAASIYIPLN